MSGDPLEGRIARYRERRGNDGLFLDTVIPGCQRTVWSLIGRNVGEDRSEKPPIPPDGFHLAVIAADPGEGSALHDHTTVEVFMGLSGSWQVVYGPGGERAVTLERLDVCSVPPGVWRGFRNVGTSRAELLAIVGGTDAGRLTWADFVLEEAAKRGRTLDAEGFLPEREGGA